MAEITNIHGNIFTTDCDTIINTVNCVGVMGAGIALECSYRFNGLEEAYQEACKKGSGEEHPRIRIGSLFMYQNSKPRVLCLPTKKHWKGDSEISYIERGLEEFKRTYKSHDISSIAIPHLGCSHGGLNWENQVEQVVLQYLEPLDNLRVDIYSFDANADDPLYDQLVEHLRHSDIQDIKKDFDLKKQYAEKLLLAVESGNINNMFGLQRIDGLGKTTMRKVYGVLQSDNKEKQASFEF